MKPESDTPQPSPRELLEERVIALLLGELSDNDAAEIKALMQADASLQAFHDEMAQTIGVVSDAHQGAAVEESERSGAPAKLDSARRKALLAVIGEAVEDSVKEAPPPAEKIARPWFRHSLVKIAAALIALCVPLGGLFLSINSKPKMGAVMSGAAASGEALDKGLTSDDFDAEADEAPVDELSMARPSQAPAEAFTFRANPEGAEFSVNLQVQAADPGSEPNVRFSTIDQAEQPLFLPGQSQSAARRMYFGRSDAREKEAAGADPFVGNSRGRVRVADESRLAELVQAPVSERQSVSPGRVAGIAGRRALEESAPVQVDTLHSEVELADKRVESRRKGEPAAKDVLPADGLLDAFGAPIGGLLPDTMDRSRMDALFEQAADGSGIAAFRGGQQAERRLGRSRASGITTLSVVPPTGDGFVSGPRGAKQDQNQKAQFGWAIQAGQASTSVDRASSPPADSIVIGGGFRAPEAEERKARGLAQLQTSGKLAAAKLPALQGRQEMDAKSAKTVWFDSGVAEPAKAKLELNLEVAGEVPPPAAEPAPAAPASPTSASVVAKGMSRVTAASVSKSSPKGGAVVISGVSDQYDFAKAKQDVVAGKPLAIMNGERGQPMQEQIAREAMTESRRRNLAEVERLSRRSESKAIVENASRAALQPMFKQLADQSESLAKLEKNLTDSESQLAAKEAQVKQQLVELGEAIGGGMGGGGGAMDRLDAWRRSQEEFRSAERAIEISRFDGEGKIAEQKAAMWDAAKEEFRESMASLARSETEGKDRTEYVIKGSRELAKLSAAYSGIYRENQKDVGESQVQRQLDQLSELRGSAEREIEYTKSKMNAAARQMAVVQKGVNKGEIEKWQREVNAWQSRADSAQKELEKVEAKTQEALTRYQEEMFDGEDAEMEVGDVVTLFVLEDNSLNGHYPIQKDGTIVVPGLGKVKLGKQDIASAERTLKKAFESKLLRQATVMVERTPNVGEVLLESKAERDSAPAKKPVHSKPNPEIQTKDNAFSTFSLNVSDVSFKLAAASLEQGQLPDPATVRSEEFVNALNYRDPAPTGGEKLSFAWERAGDPFQHNRDLIRFSIQTAAVGRESGRPLNIVVLLDNSGSMERADRLAIVRRALLTLAEQMTPNDRISIVAFARTPRLWVNGMKGGNPEELVSRVMNLIPQGGTNLEAALDLGYEVARSHFRPDGNNRVILLTDGAANLGDVEPERLKAKTEAQRKEGIALDCFGIGWEGLNDAMLGSLTRNADGRYGFLNTEREAREDFAEQLAGALQVAASNVKAQVEFNPRRVLSYRQIGYEKHQLKKEQFRDNTVDAAEIGAAESGTALYSIQVNHQGQGPLGVARIRFLNPGTGVYEELEWPLPYRKDAPSLADAAPSLRLAGTAAAFAEWLAKSPYAGGVSPVALQNLLSGVADAYPNDERPKQLEAMIRQARQIAGATGGP